jgi:hypothetical protein
MGVFWASIAGQFLSTCMHVAAVQCSIKFMPGFSASRHGGLAHDGCTACWVTEPGCCLPGARWPGLLGEGW